MLLADRSGLSSVATDQARKQSSETRVKRQYVSLRIQQWPQHQSSDNTVNDSRAPADPIHDLTSIAVDPAKRSQARPAWLLCLRAASLVSSRSLTSFHWSRGYRISRYFLRPTVKSGKEVAACVESTAPEHVITCPVTKPRIIVQQMSLLPRMWPAPSA